MGTIENEGESDELIAPLLEGWTLERIPTIDRIILRMSAFELNHRKEIAPAVVINEAVELAKKFSTEDSGRYVNGVLGRLLGKVTAYRVEERSVPQPQRGTDW